MHTATQQRNASERLNATILEIEKKRRINSIEKIRLTNKLIAKKMKHKSQIFHKSRTTSEDLNQIKN